MTRIYNGEKPDSHDTVTDSLCVQIRWTVGDRCAIESIMRFSPPLGGLAEWLKAAVLKTVRWKRLVSSNLTSSARI